MTAAEAIERWNPRWKNRRRTIFTTLIFNATVIAYVVIQNTDSLIHKSALETAFTLSGLIIASYVFGVVWQDTKLRKPQ